MKTLPREILRWGVIVASAGIGLWQLVDAGRRFAMRWQGGWLDALFLLIFPLLVATPLLAIAYICLRRQYRKLFLVLGVVGCIVIFAELSALPEQLGVCQFVDHRMHENHDYAFLGLPLAVLLFFGPIYAAAWFYRVCHRLAYPGAGKKPKTRATRWLVWLGVLCIVLAPIIEVGVALNRISPSSTPPVNPESFDNAFSRIVGFSVIGGLLMFLGLVRRQPILESRKPTSPPATTQF